MTAMAASLEVTPKHCPVLIAGGVNIETLLRDEGFLNVTGKKNDETGEAVERVQDRELRGRWNFYGLKAIIADFDGNVWVGRVVKTTNTKGDFYNLPTRLAEVFNLRGRKLRVPVVKKAKTKKYVE